MNKFLKTYNLPKLNQEEIKNFSRMTTNNEIESVSEKLSTNKSSDSFTGEFYQTFKNELILILLKLFQKIEEDQNHSMRLNYPGNKTR